MTDVNFRPSAIPFAYVLLTTTLDAIWHLGMSPYPSRRCEHYRNNGAAALPLVLAQGPGPEQEAGRRAGLRLATPPFFEVNR